MRHQALFGRNPRTHLNPVIKVQLGHRQGKVAKNDSVKGGRQRAPLQPLTCCAARVNAAGVRREITALNQSQHVGILHGPVTRLKCRGSRAKNNVMMACHPSTPELYMSTSPTYCDYELLRLLLLVCRVGPLAVQRPNHQPRPQHLLYAHSIVTHQEGQRKKVLHCLTERHVVADQLRHRHLRIAIASSVLVARESRAQSDSRTGIPGASRFTSSEDGHAVGPSLAHNISAHLQELP